MLIIWDEKIFSVGIHNLDAQHRELITQTNKLSDTLAEKDSVSPDVFNDRIKSVTKSLYNYANYHFLSEEELFSKYDFPEIEEHKKIHAKFTKLIKNYLGDSHGSEEFSLEYLQDFLVEWIINHIQVEDRKYADFFQKNSISESDELDEKKQVRKEVNNIWIDKKLQLNIVEMDNQHRELVNILQQTNDLQRVSDTRKDLFMPIILKKLIFYAQYHFSYEEEQMARYNFNRIHTHKGIHKSFVQDINSFYEKLKNGDANVTDQLISYLKNWVVEHILQEDKLLKDALISNTQFKSGN